MRPPNSRFAAQRLDCGGATRARGQGPDNGDALVIRQWNSLALLGVVDGLGHGQFARKAANAARTYLEQHYDQPLDNLFRGVERACCATRGVVMALARFDLLQGKLLAASVGNVEVRVVEGPAPFHLMPRRGILGLRAPSPHITGHTWSEGSLLIMHSDGLAGRWGWHEFKELADQSPAVIARGLLNRLAKPEDDATVLVARNSRA
jgi:serine/threonine protein phosphatase PrpC